MEIRGVNELFFLQTNSINWRNIRFICIKNLLETGIKLCLKTVFFYVIYKIVLAEDEYGSTISYLRK